MKVSMPVGLYGQVINSVSSIILNRNPNISHRYVGVACDSERVRFSSCADGALMTVDFPVGHDQVIFEGTGKGLLDHRRALQLLSSFTSKDKQASLSWDDGSWHGGHRALVRCGEHESKVDADGDTSYTYLLSLADFGGEVSDDWVEIKIDDLPALIGHVEFAMGLEQGIINRGTNSIKLEFSAGKIEVQATDTTRFASYEREFPYEGDPRVVFFDHHVVSQIKRHRFDQLYLGPRAMALGSSNTQVKLYFHYSEGAGFPDFRILNRFHSGKVPYTISVPRSPLAEALGRLSLFSDVDKPCHLMRKPMDAIGEMVLFVGDEARESIPYEVVNGPNRFLEVSLPLGGHLLKSLESIDSDQVALLFSPQDKQEKNVLMAVRPDPVPTSHKYLFLMSTVLERI